MSINRLSQFDFHQRLNETPGVSLVMFSGAHCGACRHWRALLQQLVAEDAGLSLFEVDAGRDEALSREFEVFHLPTLFVFRDGEFHAPLQAEASPESLRRALAEVLAAPAEEAP